MEVSLISPRVLLDLIGGASIQTVTYMKIRLGTGITLVANYCPWSCLPLLDITNASEQRIFWAEDFVYNSSIAYDARQQGIIVISN